MCHHLDPEVQTMVYNSYHQTTISKHKCVTKFVKSALIHVSNVQLGRCTTSFVSKLLKEYLSHFKYNDRQVLLHCFKAAC